MRTVQPVVSAVIAAAGLGSRLGAGVPKCMIEIGGRTLLSRLVQVLAPHVETIRLVIGYRAKLVADYCARHHRDVVLVHNADFSTTTATQSFALGAARLTGKTVFLDGDLLISPSSMADFLRAASAHEILVGLTDAKSEDAVLVSGVPDGDTIRIDGFSRDIESPYEWANVVAGPSDLLNGTRSYVFERLIEHLPLPGRMIELSEVDTEADLEAARKTRLAT